jgi:hypothetical protein
LDLSNIRNVESSLTFSTWGTENSLTEINLESTGDETFLGSKNWQTLAALWAGALSCNKKNSRKQKSYFRTRRTTVLGMFKDSAIILDAIRRSFFNKSATAAMFTSVQVDFRRPPLSSSSTSSLPSRNLENHLKTFDRFTASFP